MFKFSQLILFFLALTFALASATSSDPLQSTTATTISMRSDIVPKNEASSAAAAAAQVVPVTTLDDSTEQQNDSSPTRSSKAWYEQMGTALGVLAMYLFLLGLIIALFIFIVVRMCKKRREQRREAALAQHKELTTTYIQV